MNINMTLTLPTGEPQLLNPDNFFFCWGIEPQGSGFTCEAYSESFSMGSPPQKERALLRGRRRVEAVAREVDLLPRFSGTPTQALAITQSTPVLSISNSPVRSTTPITQPAAPTSSAVTVTASAWTTTYTPVPSATSPASQSDASGSSHSKLGTGPIVGIAVGGAVVLILIAFLAFFCVRRRRPDSEAKEMLLQDGSAGSRDALHGVQGEKRPSSIIPSVPMLSFLETRPSSGPFDHLERSEPYFGPAGPMVRSRPPSTAVPGASTTASTSTALAAGALGASAGAAGAAAVAAAKRVSSTAESLMVPDHMSEAPSPHTERSLSTYSVPYSDIPTYGETRHTPQLYESPSQTPFLSEPGMSAEELSRLEEEERRIDAAIAAAEAAEASWR
jgi:hypothetical protein